MEWCRDFEHHATSHTFCEDHQLIWCAACDEGCPGNANDPRCAECHCSLYEEDHEWDCSYADDEH